MDELITVDCESASPDQKTQDAYYQRLLPEHNRLIAALNTQYANAYGVLNLVDDYAMIEQVKRIAAEKCGRGYRVLVVIGIGGSSLGVKAVYEALSGYCFNVLHPDFVWYCLETVDPDYTFAVITALKKLLDDGKKVLVNVVSKSGTTTETIALFSCIQALLSNYKSHAWVEGVVVTTDQNSALWEWASRQTIACLPIPLHVGGRFSVFSPVGLFPLMVLGVDIDALCSGARAMRDRCLARFDTTNPAAASAVALFYQYERGLTIHDTFVASMGLTAFGAWYRQLVGESLGKISAQGARVGITPTVSVATQDLHSVGQLYFGGPRDKMTTFITVASFTHAQYGAQHSAVLELAPYLRGHTLASIMKSIMQAVCNAYQEQALPFIHCNVQELSEHTIGALLQWKMIEIMYVGYLLQVNPFDQPHVEAYKQATRKILAHE